MAEWEGLCMKRQCVESRDLHLDCLEQLVDACGEAAKMQRVTLVLLEALEGLYTASDEHLQFALEHALEVGRLSRAMINAQKIIALVRGEGSDG